MTDNQISELEGSVFDTAEFITYQDGAIVSRTLIDREAATLTIFAYDADQTVSEHTAPHQAMIRVLEGQARVTVDGTEHEPGAGEAVAMSSGTPHSVAAVEPFKMMLTMVR